MNKTIIESNLSQSAEDRAWTRLGMECLAKDWDNELDAIYDNWEERYGISEG